MVAEAAVADTVAAATTWAAEGSAESKKPTGTVVREVPAPFLSKHLL